MTVCAYGGTCPPEGCSLCRSPEPYPEPSIEDYCWPHPYYGDDMTAAIGSDEAVPIGRCYCGKQLYPAGGPKWPLSRPRRRGIHASSPPPGPWRPPSAPPPGGRWPAPSGGGGVDDDDTLVGELRRIAANLTAVTAEDCREIGLDDPAEQIAYSDQEAAFFASCADEIERLRADLAAERALADRLGRRLLGPCYGENDVASDWQPAIAEHCPTCLNYPSGTCPPIPAKGRPGIWRWEP